jgi:hypothetical protein
MTTKTYGTAAGIAHSDLGGGLAARGRTGPPGGAIPRPARGPGPGSRLRAAFAAALATAGILAGVGAAVPPPGGDPAAIGVYSRQADAYGRVAGVRIVETGFFAVRRGSGDQVDYMWGSPPAAGYVPATGTIVARLDDGRIVAYFATLRAPRVRAVRVLMAGGSVWSSTAGCWRTAAASASPLGTGDSYVLNDGGARFRRLRHAGTTSDVTFTYDWRPGAPATETSAFGAHVPSPFVVTVTVRGAERLSIHRSVTPLDKAPALPVPEPPLRPVPKPICAT